MEKVLCIIPARSGSKRIPNKNIHLLEGKPLIAYTIEAALNSGIFNKIVVSSDSEQILEIASRNRIDGDLRPEYLAGDEVPVVKVVEQYLLRSEIHNVFKHVCLLLPTYPFRFAEDIRKAFHTYKEVGGDFLVGVSKYDFPVQLAMTLDADLKLAMREPEMYRKTTRSQSIETTYHPDGSIYLAKVESFLKAKTFFTENLYGYEMPKEYSVDIDYPYQLKIAEYLAKQFNGELRQNDASQ